MWGEGLANSHGGLCVKVVLTIVPTTSFEREQLPQRTTHKKVFKQITNKVHSITYSVHILHTVQKDVKCFM
jgi:hypothetical protein